MKKKTKWCRETRRLKYRNLLRRKKMRERERLNRVIYLIGIRSPPNKNTVENTLLFNYLLHTHRELKYTTMISWPSFLSFYFFTFSQMKISLVFSSIFCPEGVRLLNSFWGGPASHIGPCTHIILVGIWFTVCKCINHFLQWGSCSGDLWEYGVLLQTRCGSIC